MSFERIATTKDTNEPVVEARFDDTDSFAQMIIQKEKEIIRVVLVESNFKGDMKRILDTVVSQTGFTHILFLTPLNDRLEKHLDGFEEVTEYVEKIGEKIIMIEGEWNI